MSQNLNQPDYSACNGHCSEGVEHLPPDDDYWRFAAMADDWEQEQREEEARTDALVDEYFLEQGWTSRMNPDSCPPFPDDV